MSMDQNAFCKRLILSVATGFALVFAVFAIFLEPAHARLEVCNETGKKRDIAIGYKTSGVWTSEGWWGIENGECKILIDDALDGKFYYYRAKHKGGDFKGDDYFFCTLREPFTIQGDENCKARGYSTENFKQFELKRGQTDYKLVLENSSASNDVAKNTDEGDTPPKRNPSSEPYGEPYKVVGIFKGCDWVDQTLTCKFDAEGWRYLIPDDGRTKAEIIRALNGLPRNSIVDLRGELLQFGDVTIAATIREYEVVRDDEHSKRLARLVGLWQSLTDPDYTIRITLDGRKYDYSQGELTSEGDLSFTTSCKDKSVLPSDDVLIQIIDPFFPDDALCYSIIELNSQIMTLVYLPRGNALEFARIGN